ncbi:hypothetical protein LXL04_033276 [Taraxacum kok-saghyz]
MNSPTIVLTLSKLIQSQEISSEGFCRLEDLVSKAPATSKGRKQRRAQVRWSGIGAEQVSRKDPPSSASSRKEQLRVRKKGRGGRRRRVAQGEADGVVGWRRRFWFRRGGPIGREERWNGRTSAENVFPPADIDPCLLARRRKEHRRSRGVPMVDAGDERETGKKMERTEISESGDLNSKMK